MIEEAWRAGEEDGAADLPLTPAEAEAIARRAGRPAIAALLAAQSGDGDERPA
jgi:hypothetical protein